LYEAEANARHHSEGSLAAGEETGEVVAGVVLERPREAGKDPTVGEYRLEPRNLGSHYSMAHDVNPARVGRDHAPDARRPAGGVIDAEG
jgi:hypothetical protein